MIVAIDTARGAAAGRPVCVLFERLASDTNGHNEADGSMRGGRSCTDSSGPSGKV